MIPKIECSDFGGGARRPIMELELGTPSFSSTFVLKMIITFVNPWYYFAKVQVVKDAFLRSVDALRNRSHEELHLLV